MALDYDNMILLDAEDLAEGGIKEAYESLVARLREFGVEPLTIEEEGQDSAASYAVVAGGKRYVVYDADTAEESWGRAAVIFFTIVNEQLAHTGYRLYAVNGGNDLMGGFLTDQAAEGERQALPNRKDWPYIPVDGGPWYGQFH